MFLLCCCCLSQNTLFSTRFVWFWAEEEWKKKLKEERMVSAVQLIAATGHRPFSCEWVVALISFTTFQWIVQNVFSLSLFFFPIFFLRLCQEIVSFFQLYLDCKRFANEQYLQLCHSDEWNATRSQTNCIKSEKVSGRVAKEFNQLWTLRFSFSLSSHNALLTRSLHLSRLSSESSLSVD